MIYVISDIHGQYTALMNILEYIKFSYNDKLYVLGDMIDRGDDGLKVFDYCFNTSNVYPLKGNHEIMMQEALSTDTEESLELWYLNGGVSTSKYIKEKKQADKYIKMINNLPSYYDISVQNNEFLLVHAGISFSGAASGYYFDSVDKEDILKYSKENNYFYWARDDFESQQTLKHYLHGYKMIHGHTPINKKCEWNSNIINIDTGAGQRKRLSCYCIEKNTIVSYNMQSDTISEYIPIIKR